MSGGRILVLAAVLTLSLAPTCATGAGTVHTKYNIHLQCKADREGAIRCEGSYANWTDPGEGHYILPMNTPVRAERGRGRAFNLILQEPGAVKLPTGRIAIEFDAGRMRMNMDQYIDLITSPVPVPTSGFNAKDQEGIRAGKALIGMTKEGVLAALGYPAAHFTPSLESGSYVYWKNRFTKIKVDFNDKGLVVGVQ